MSFYIRKSVKFGPLRFNLSKSGVGVSFGVRGARVSTGPRGTYVNMGSHGVYYRQKIDGSIGDHPSDSSKTSFDNTFERENVNIDKLVESSNKNLLDQINFRIHQPKSAFLVGLISTLIAGGVFLLGLVIQSFLTTISFLWFLFFGISGILWIFGLWLAWVTSQQEKLAQTTTLQYALDENAKENFSVVQTALENLAKSVRIWAIISDVATFDWKRNAGVSSLITRKRISVGQANPPFIQTRIKVYSLMLNTIEMYFLPDQILIFKNGKYGAVSYSSLQIHEMPMSFVENESVPSDSRVISHTWQYVRKDGGPDMRFKNNRRLPVMEYGYIEISSQTGLKLHFCVSNLIYAEQFTKILLNYARYSQSPNSKSSGKTSSNHQYRSQSKTENITSAESKDEGPYTVLNLSPNASWDEISAAYRKMAQMYHPDKVAALAPEYQEISEKRMKAINSAYDQLKREFERK